MKPTWPRREDARTREPGRASKLAVAPPRHLFQPSNLWPPVCPSAAWSLCPRIGDPSGSWIWVYSWTPNTRQTCRLMNKSGADFSIIYTQASVLFAHQFLARFIYLFIYFTFQNKCTKDIVSPWSLFSVSRAGFLRQAMRSGVKTPTRSASPLQNLVKYRRERKPRARDVQGWFTH